MTTHFKSGESVRWNWGAHKADGKIKEVFTRRVQRTLKGEKVVRNGSKDEPAYLIEQEDGDKVLKSHSELEKH